MVFVKEGRYLSFGHQGSGSTKGFILTELIISLAIFLIITAAILNSLTLSSNKITAFMDYRKAMIRTAKAVALLKMPAFYCGFGMPVGAAEYKKAFGNQKFDPFRWEGPIKSYTGPSGFADSELRIAFAAPGRSRLTKMTLSETKEGYLYLDKLPEKGDIGESFSGYSFDIRNWIFFADTFPPGLPFCITGLSGKIMTVKNYISPAFSILQNDRLYHFRAIRIYCLNGTVYTKDHRSPGDQPRVSGIMDMRFQVDAELKTLTVYVLARGDHEYSEKREIIDAYLWPEEYISPWKDKRSKYQLYASKTVWRLPNCTRENLMNMENASIKEQF